MRILRGTGFAKTVLVPISVLITAALAGCAPAARQDVPPPSAGLPERTEIVSVYYATGRSLLEERKTVDADNRYVATLEVLLAGEPKNPNVAIVQPDAKFESATLADGVLTIDWDRAVLDFEADPEEYHLAWAGLLLTFGQFPDVEKLAFTVEGKTSGEIDGKDIEEFWGKVTLKDQPWAVTRPPGYKSPNASAEETKKSEPESPE